MSGSEVFPSRTYALLLAPDLQSLWSTRRGLNSRLSPEEDQEKEKDEQQAQSTAGIIAPGGAVWVDGQGSKQERHENDPQNSWHNYFRFSGFAELVPSHSLARRYSI